MEEFSKDGELIVKGPKGLKGATKAQKAVGLKVGLLWLSCKKSFFLFSSSCYIVLGVVLLQFLSFYRILHLLFGGQKATKSPGTGQN